MKATASVGSEGFDPSEFERLFQIEPGSFWFEVRNELITWALRRHAPRARSLLEIGCGTGFVLAAISRAAPGMRLVGTELYEEGLQFSRERVPEAELAQMDARALPYESEFDAVGAFDVLEHIDEDELVLGEIHRALRPGGVLLATVPQHPWLWSANDITARHCRRYTRAELTRKASRAGFEVERITSFVSLLLPLMTISRLTRRRSNGGESSEFAIGHLANAALKRVLRAELDLIKRGVSLPAGGSLLLVARKPLDCRLEPITLEHADAMSSWMSDPRLPEALGVRSRPSSERTREWIRRAQSDSAYAAFAVIAAGDHVGNVVLDQIATGSSARLSIYVGGEEDRGRGIGGAALRLALDHAFGALGLSRVWLIAHARNRTAIRLYERCGFAFEGAGPEKFVVDGEEVETIRMAIERTDWTRR